LLLLLGVFSGCVPVTRFEETQSAAQVEMEGRRRSEYQASQLQTENAELRAQMQQQRQSLDERDQALSQAQLDSSTQGKQRQDAEGMVDQLRGELARVGGHLQSFHDDQRKLETALTSEAARGRALSRLSRDAALSLPEPIATGEYTLDAEQGSIVLRVPRAKLLTDDGSVKPEAEPVLKVVARLMQLHKQARLRVEDSAAAGDPLAVSRLVAALTERAVAAERFEPLAAQADAAAPKTREDAEIAFGFSVL
jgi:chromosome segregation ATPase